MKGNKLTPKQAAFVREYMIDLNATQAAIRAGFSKKSAARMAVELLNKSHVSEAVVKAQAKRAEKTEITAEKVLRELALMGFANMLDYMTTTPEGDAFVDLSNMTRDQAAAVSEITVEEYVEGRGEGARTVKRTKFKLHDKKGSLELIARHLGMFNDKVIINADALIKVFQGIDESKV